MIINLFSIFDPSLRLFSMCWMMLFIGILLFPCLFWAINCFYFYYIKLINLWIVEINYVITKPIKGVYSFILRVFFLLFVYNFFAIFPHIFSVTSHLLVSLPLAYRFWLGIIFFRLFKSFYGFLVHLIPVGTPLGLMRFIVVVEILSNLIRPIALAFRLTANMIAGHLLIRLMGGALLSLSFLGLFVGSFFQMLLVFMELGVSVIQSYVFSTLLLLYLSESEH